MQFETLVQAEDLDHVTTRMMRKELLDSYGPEETARLHRAIPILDFFALIGLPGLFIANFFVLAHVESWLIAIAIAAVQGLLMTLMGLLNHDLFVHRVWLGPTLARTIGTFLVAPVQIPFSEYRRVHLKHHRYVGSDADPERYKLSIDSRLRRLVFCTFVGLKLAMGGRWTTSYMGTEKADRTKWYWFEFAINRLVLLGMLWLAIHSPWLGLFGYFVPLLIVAPLLNSFRIIIEHAHRQTGEKCGIATYYKTGFLSRAIFLWDSGDCHVLHHLFPAIPFYRISRGLRLAQPVLRSWGFVSIDSYSELLRGWFLRAYPHGTDWRKLAQETALKERSPGAAD
ncbi:MAG: fatty acid desaturase [Burkholderiaceae bacterium]